MELMEKYSLNKKLLSKELWMIADKIEQDIPLSLEDGVLLFESNDLHGIGSLAHAVCHQKNGNIATYIINRYINYSNICLLKCQFCAFRAKKQDAHAFELSIEEIQQKVIKAEADGVTEIHMVGGLHPTLLGSWYIDLLRGIKKVAPKIHIKAFTAIEIRHLTYRIFKNSISETLIMLKEAGLDSLTGGGAEIFNQEIRQKICRGKESADEWLEVHRIWHQMGGKSTATMLYGHIETPVDRLEHLIKLRTLQNETGGFSAFIPLSFVPTTTELSHIKPISGIEELKNIAISRLFLDNFSHITAYWIALGLPLASIALNYGADDLHGTIEEEIIFHSAGSLTPQKQSVKIFEKAIREAGKQPKERNSFYERITNKK